MLIRLTKAINAAVKSLKIPKDFHRQAYFALNPDVNFLGIDAEEHYIRFGKHENRLYRLSDIAKKDLPLDFDAKTYVEINPDIAESGISAELHYRLYGELENREYIQKQIQVINIPENFDEATYLALNADVANGELSAIEHYLQYGCKEGRKYRSTLMLRSLVPDDFDDQSYLDLNSDLVELAINPKEHYLDFGFKENRLYKSENKEDFDIGRLSSLDDYPVINHLELVNKLPNIDKLPKIVVFYSLSNIEDVIYSSTIKNNNARKEPSLDESDNPHPRQHHYLDLDDRSTSMFFNKRIKAATSAGIHGFCYMYFWPDDSSPENFLLQKVLESNEITLEFCICWANQKTKQDKKQKISPIIEPFSSIIEHSFIENTIKFLDDIRYMRVNGKLLLIIAQASLLSNCLQTVSMWRRAVRTAGLGEIHLCAMEDDGMSDPISWGFDAVIEFPSDKFCKNKIYRVSEKSAHSNINKQNFFQYSNVVSEATGRIIKKHTWHRSVFHKNSCEIDDDSTEPAVSHKNLQIFKDWLTDTLKQQIIMVDPELRVVFVSSETIGNHSDQIELEQSPYHSMLHAITDALKRAGDESEIMSILKRLAQPGDYKERVTDCLNLLHLLRGKEQSLLWLLSPFSQTKMLAEQPGQSHGSTFS